MGLLRRNSSKTSTARTAALAGLTGAAGAYFFDPHSGNRRRAMARDRIGAFFRRGAQTTADRVQTSTQMATDKARGVAAQAKRAAQPEQSAPNDQALADRVKSEIFRPDDVPKGSINVNAEEGIVYLRGEVKRPEDMKALVEAARKVDGVRGVENLLHLPKTPPRHKQETEEETRRRVTGAAKS